jgi:rhodanese-related sulfurtransferase
MRLKAKRSFKNALFEQFARIGKALASGRRLEILELLGQGERTVEAISQQTDMSVASASQHLQVLKAAQLVEVRRNGLYARYRLADERVFQLWQALRELAEVRLSDVERVMNTFLKQRGSMSPITAEELLRKLRDKSVMVLDVRPAVEYASGHIAGARSIPLHELRRKLKALPKRREIVAYCRGPYCVLADEAVAILRAQGLRARRLQEGFPDWKVRGLPVQSLQVRRRGGG